MSRISEAQLFEALRRPIRTERCICGGEITAQDGNDDDVVWAVHEHQQTAIHREWRVLWEATVENVARVWTKRLARSGTVTLESKEPGS